MLVAEHWPEMPEPWQPLDARLNTALDQVPVCAQQRFSKGERLCLRAASADGERDEIAKTLRFADLTVRNYLLSASQKVRATTQPDLERREREAEDISEERGSQQRMLLHGLVYIAHDSRVIPVVETRDPPTLLPEEAIFIKRLALNFTFNAAIAHYGIREATFRTQRFSDIQEKMNAKTTQGIIGNAYRMRLFVPKAEAQR